MVIYRSLLRDQRRFGGLSWWLIFRCLPALLLTMLTLLLLSAATARAEQGSLAGVGSGQLLLSDAAGTAHPAVMQRSEIDLEIAGMVAVVRLQQVFRNDTAKWMEGVYVFPLPGNAAVRAMHMQLGERRIIGQIQEKSAARSTYKAALKAGKKASLLEQQRPNLFTTRVANIAPGEEVLVSLEFVQQVDYRAGTFSLRLPTTITARYIPGVPLERGPADGVAELNSHGWALPTDQVADANAVSPPQHRHPGNNAKPLNPLSIRVRLDAGMPLASVEATYHDVALARRERIYELELADGVAEMDRDFELVWRPVTGAAPTAALFTERVDDAWYGLLMVLPPQLERAPSPPPRELVLVVDTSGSMGGEPIRQARASVSSALQWLRPEDTFNIIEFNDSHRALFSRARPATAHNLQLAMEFTRHLQASGGTEMLSALRAALLSPVSADELAPQPALRQVVFITDGAVANEDALFSEIASSLGASRLFTVAIGSAPNSWFMRRAADFGRGSFTAIGQVSEVAGKMAALFRQLASPVAVDLEVDWPAGAEVWPQRVPDLYLGEPLVLAVRLHDAPPQQALRVSGRLANTHWQNRVPWPGATKEQAGSSHDGVASLWARKKIQSLLGTLRHGESSDAVRGEVLALALQHQLLSPYTSFVAVEQVISRPDDADTGSAAVPNTRPAGQSPQPYAFARTATTAAAKLWFGCLLLLLAVVVYACRQEGRYA